MHHITFIKQWDIISIPASSSLDHYTTNGVNCSGFCFEDQGNSWARHVVVGCHALVCGIIHPYQKWYMPHMPFIKQKASISTPASSSVDHYTTDDWWGTLFRLFLFWKTRVTAKHIRGVVEGHDMFCGVIHPCHMLSMPHIIHIKQWDSISIPLSSSLDHYTTGEVHCTGSFFQNKQGISWAPLGCNWRSFSGLWGDLSLSDVVYAS